MKDRTVTSFAAGLSATAFLFAVIALINTPKAEAFITPPAQQTDSVSFPAPPKIDFEDETPEKPTDTFEIPELPNSPQKKSTLSPLEINLDLTPTPENTGPANWEPKADFGNDVQSSDFAEIWDLDQAPAIIEAGKFKSPNRKSTKTSAMGDAKVEVMILPTGVVEVIRIVTCSHPNYSEAVLDFAESSKFTEPTSSGKAVRARYLWKIKFPVD